MVAVLYRYELMETLPPDAITMSCGIMGWQKREGHWHPVVIAAPFSKDREAVIHLAQRCTALQLDPRDLMDELIAFQTGEDQTT
jgi:hypothetical protein